MIILKLSRKEKKSADNKKLQIYQKRQAKLLILKIPEY